MIKIKLLSTYFLVFVVLIGAKGQILSTHNTSSMTIHSGTIFHAGGITLVPSSLFKISGENSLRRDTIIDHPVVNAMVDRAYFFKNVIEGYKGMIHFNYDDSELNDLDETGLELHIHDGINWKPHLVGNHDRVNNIHSSFVTSGLHRMTLIDRKSLINRRQPLPVHVLTNPVYGGKLNLLVEKECELIIYNAYGQLLETRKLLRGFHQLNLSRYPPGVYYIQNPVTRSVAVPIVVF